MTASRIAEAEGTDCLRTFLAAMTELVGRTEDEDCLLREGKPLLAALVARDDWLPAAAATPNSQHYQQHLLHCDPLERFSVVSFVWGPGQATPIHDHGVWGLVGMLRGAESCRNYVWHEGSLAPVGSHLLRAGQVLSLSPRHGDLHAVANAHSDRTSISVHVYGANIGAVARSVFDPETGARKPFVSGYANSDIPNIWDRSEAVRRGLTNATAVTRSLGD